MGAAVPLRNKFLYKISNKTMGPFSKKLLPDQARSLGNRIRFQGAYLKRNKKINMAATEIKLDLSNKCLHYKNQY